mmetsp:Transcript_28224/g.84445  ORF Transcript_28224/g.84445 Transcript_28224/m.84445 type:complete len:1475 (+) Transcript_28224:40-4464(+)
MAAAAAAAAGPRRGRPGSVYKFGSAANSAASELDEVNSLTKPEERVRHVFGGLVDESEETRRHHRERLGDKFFTKFDLSSEALPDGGKTIRPCGCDTFPSTRTRQDTLSTASHEAPLRANASIDESYQTSVQAVVAVEGQVSATLLDLVRDTFQVDDATHQGCILQVAGMVDAADASLVINMNHLRVAFSDALPPGEGMTLLAMVEAVTNEPPEVKSKRTLAKRLRKAIEAAAKDETTLGDVRELLAQGADPNMTTGRKESAMSIAVELNNPSLTTLLVDNGGDPSLVPNSRRKQSQTILQGSSGVFETILTRVEDGVAIFPDSFVIPLPDGADGATKNTVNVEIWRTNAPVSVPNSPTEMESEQGGKDGAAAAAASIDAGQRGKRKRVRRRFFRGRSQKSRQMANDSEGCGRRAPPARVIIEKDGMMIEFLGVVRFPVEELAVGKPQVLKLEPIPEQLPYQTKDPTIAVEMTVRLSSDVSEILRSRRKQHQDVLEKILRSATRNYCASSPPMNQPWDGRELRDFLPIIDLHSRWARVSPVQSALDTLCSVIETSGAIPVSAIVVLPLLKALCDLCPKGFDDLDDISRDRLVAALESIVTSYFHVATHPHKFVERNGAGMTELHACVSILRLVYSIDEWQQATIGLSQSVDDDPDVPVPLDAPILVQAAELVDTQLVACKIDYRSIKSGLLEAHSVETFESHKRTIQQLCAEAAAELDRKRIIERDVAVGEKGRKQCSGRENDVVVRAREIIASNAKKLLTYPTIKAQLVKEFGVRVVSEHRRVISAEIVLAMGRRLCIMQQLKQMTDGQPPTRVLAVELTAALENFVKECYENIRHRVKTSLGAEFEGHELVMLVRTMDALVIELEGIQTWYHNAYRDIPGMVLTNSFALWYDKLVSADLRSVLSMWEHRCTENDFPWLFFNVLFSARRLWDWMELNLGEMSVADFRLFQYREWFYPFVTAWLIQSKAAALHMVERAINLDKWRPVTDNTLVSDSSVDITRIVYEVVMMYQKINWPDREANEEQLFQLLADAVCACFRTYSITIKEYCAKQIGGCKDEVANGRSDVDGHESSDFFIDDGTCIILNNLEYVSVRLHGLHRFMQVAEVAESHRRRAEREIQGHRGNIKPHGAVRLFHNANSHIQKCIISLGNKIAERLCVRLQRDLMIVFDRFRNVESASSESRETVRAAELEDAIDGLVSEQDDLRAALPKNPTKVNRRNIFECSPLYQAVRTRKAIVARKKQLKPDGYVFVNFCILASKMEYLETRNKIVECFWQCMLVILGSVLSRQMCDESTTADQLLGLTMEVNRQLTEFLVDGGDGMPHAELENLSATYLNPICSCFRMTSQELVRYLHMNVACAHNSPISDHVHKARMDKGDAPTVTRLSRFSMMNQYTINVNADVTSSGVDSVRLTAGEMPSQNLGCLRLRLLRFGDDTRGKSLRVNLVGGMKLPRNNVYVKARVIGSSGEDTAVKF